MSFGIKVFFLFYSLFASSLSFALVAHNPAPLTVGCAIANFGLFLIWICIIFGDKQE